MKARRDVLRWNGIRLALLAMAVGCGTRTVETDPTRADRRSEAGAPAAGGPTISWDTRADQRFAEFLRENAAGMIAQAAVGIDRRGELRVELDRSVAPEDTLDLTTALISGARNDFPGKPFTLSLYDPDGGLILKAREVPGEGVFYQLAQDEGTGAERGGDAVPPDRAGTTASDRAFARWAEETAGEFLRYVQADLERHGRLWFGITPEVAPEDLPELTRSLLEGARTEFPGRELRATVFDPDGQPIGTATLDADGELRWES